LRIFDLLYFVTDVSDGLNTSATNYLTNLGAITNFSIYSFLIFGGVINRFTKKETPGTSKLFLPFSFLAIFLVFFVVAAGFYGVFSGFVNKNISIQQASLDFSIFIFFYLLLIIINVVNELLIKKNDHTKEREKVVYSYTNKVE